MKVYLDNGATTRVDEKVLDSMNKVFLEDYGNPSSLHTFGEEAREILEKSRKVVAKKLNVLPEEVYFTSGGTESNNLAVRSILSLSKKKHIVTTKIEHPSIYNLFEQLKKEGYKVDYIGVDKEGFVKLDKLKKKICKDTALVAVIHGNNEIGTVQDISELLKVCDAVPLHLDAVQTFTKVDIDASKVASLSISGHKIHGPKGVGAMYLNKNFRAKGMFKGGSQEKSVRPGTENVPGVVGLAKAVEVGVDVNKIAKLRDYLIKELLKVDETRLNGPRKERLCNNVNISFKSVEGESLLMMLNLEGICVSTGSACSSQSLEPSHVLMAIGLKHGDAHGSIRFTLSKYTTKKELDYVVTKIKKSVKRLREISAV
jgi:cysteine desulfurase